MYPSHLRILCLALAGACLALATPASAQRAVIKTPGTNAIIEPLATGLQTFTVSSAGTLKWESGANLDGALDFRYAAGLIIGAQVQAWDADLNTYAAITPSANVQSLLGAASYSVMRSQLGLVIGTNVQAYSSALTTYAGISPSANVQTLLGASNYAAFKTALSLNNVENTALSTFAGTSNITTLGTIGTGVWHGTAIADTYVASASTWNAKQAGATILTTLSALSNAAGVLTNDGSGVLSYTATSSGGAGPGDAGKIVKFNGSGALGAISGVNLTALNASEITSGSLALARIAQGSASSGQALEWNGTAWAPATIASGLTIGTTAISGGTNGRLLYHSSGVLGEATLISNPSGSLGLGGYIPSSHTPSSGYAGVWMDSSNSGMVGEVAAGYKAVNIVANALRTAYDWGQQDTSKNSWILGLGYDTYGNGLNLYRSVAGNGYAFTVFFSVNPSGTAIGHSGTPHSLIKSGVVTLAAGVATVSDSDVIDTGTAATSSRILVTRMNDGGTLGTGYSITRSNATSFTITSMAAGTTQTLDTSTLSWLMINP